MYSFFENVARETKITPNHVNHKEIASRLTGRDSSLKVIKMLSRLVEVLSERCLLGLTKKELVLCSNERTCHSSARDACPQGRPGVARPSDTSAKNIGRKEYRESRRKHVDRSDGDGREYWRIGRTHQITCHSEISVLIAGLDMIG